MKEPRPAYTHLGILPMSEYFVIFCCDEGEKSLSQDPSSFLSSLSFFAINKFFFLSLSFAVSKRGLVSCKAAGKMASMGGT